MNFYEGRIPVLKDWEVQAVCLESGTVSFEALFSLTQEFFIDPLYPTDVELTLFEIEHSEHAKDKYLEIVNYYKGLGENK